LERTDGLQACLARIREREPAIHAWVEVRPRRPSADGPLAGIPFGVKDIIETRGLATEYGSPIYAGRIGMEDAAIVTALERLGAVLMGKTQTTAFAWRTPSPTRNPHDPGHTPGGSSSGSAAAVALGMVPFALGTQTLGSVLRPASFCGVTGFKPTFGTLPLAGVLPCAKSLDTLGLFTHTAADMVALWEAMFPPGLLREPRPTLLGFVDPLPGVEPDMATAFGRAVDTFRRAGFTLRRLDLAATLGAIGASARIVLAFEAARFHELRFREHGDRLHDMADLVREGLATSSATYDEAQRRIAAAKTAMGEVFASTPVILSPAALGRAPAGLSSTGDPAMNAPWTALGTPAISIPMPVDGLPLGLQLTAADGDDGLLLSTAVQAQRVFTA
jgi:Asp-tRNA(Asn)/Glu-tRNA(Gln) amidotransferase A subunit family amidase